MTRWALLFIVVLLASTLGHAASAAPTFFSNHVVASFESEQWLFQGSAYKRAPGVDTSEGRLTLKRPLQRCTEAGLVLAIQLQRPTEFVFLNDSTLRVRGPGEQITCASRGGRRGQQRLVASRSDVDVAFTIRVESPQRWAVEARSTGDSVVGDTEVRQPFDVKKPRLQRSGAILAVAGGTVPVAFDRVRRGARTTAHLSLVNRGPRFSISALRFALEIFDRCPPEAGTTPLQPTRACPAGAVDRSGSCSPLGGGTFSIQRVREDHQLESGEALDLGISFEPQRDDCELQCAALHIAGNEQGSPGQSVDVLLIGRVDPPHGTTRPPLCMAEAQR